jgi:fucose permease
VSELFPTSVRYTGSSLAFSMAGILGASLVPYIATWLAKTYGLQYVGYYYLTASAVLTLPHSAVAPEQRSIRKSPMENLSKSTRLRTVALRRSSSR